MTLLATLTTLTIIAWALLAIFFIRLSAFIRDVNTALPAGQAPLSASVFLMLFHSQAAARSLFYLFKRQFLSLNSAHVSAAGEKLRTFGVIVFAYSLVIPFEGLLWLMRII